MTSALTYRRVWASWFPLAFSWALMSMELPLVQSIVSALPDSQHSLAAIGIVFAICLMCESPILMLVSASTALVKDHSSFSKLRNFSLILSSGMSVIFFLLTLLLDLSGVIVSLCNQDQVLASKVFYACLLSAVVPLAVGNRRFFQGVLIGSGKSYLLTYGTLSRIFLIILSGFLLNSLTELDGAITGTLAGVAGMVFESLLITFLSLKFCDVLTRKSDSETPLTYAGIAEFYAPLAASGVVNLSILPVLTFFMSSAPEAISSLAAYQVLQGAIFFLSALALGMQETIISQLGRNHEGYRVLRNSVIALAFLVFTIFSVYIFSPLSAWFLVDQLGIAPALFEFLHQHIIWALPIPVLTVFSAAFRGAIVVSRRTFWITTGSALELLVVLVVNNILAGHGTGPGLKNAIMALLCARIMSSALFGFVFFKSSRSGRLSNQLYS